MKRRKKNTIKGPIFPSFLNPNLGPKKILVWAPGTQSVRQCKKNLRLKSKHILDSKDPTIVAVGDRVIRGVCHEPDPEYSALHLICAALDASEDTGESWVTCMTYMMDRFENKDGAETETTSEAPSRLSGLLRTLVPRAFRARDAAGAEGHVSQQSGDAVGQRAPGEGCDTSSNDRQSPDTSQEGAG